MHVGGSESTCDKVHVTTCACGRDTPGALSVTREGPRGVGLTHKGTGRGEKGLMQSLSWPVPKLPKRSPRGAGPGEEG